MLGKIKLSEESNVLVKLLHFTDCIMVFLIFKLISIIYEVPWSHYYTRMSWAIFFISFITFSSFRLYRPWRGSLFVHEFVVILKAWGITIGIILSLLFMTKTSYQFSRRILLTWFFVTPFIVFIVHIITRYGLRLLRKRGFNLKNAVIIGAGELGTRFALYLDEMPWAGIRILGYFTEDNVKEDTISSKYPVLGVIEEFANFVKTNSIDFIYIALPLGEEKKIDFLISRARTLGAKIFLIPDHLSFEVFNAEYQSLGDMLLISFNPNHKLKRFFDISFSIFALLITSPLFFLIGLIIKFEDWGPVFYKHKRITTTGRVFNCLKFRTMCTDAESKLKKILENDSQAREEWGKLFKLRNDPRITRIGKFLRKTSLDELPQFINVLKGEMSVVGARPIVDKELNDYYKDSAGIYCSVKPGITGPWQIEKRSDCDDYSERINLDTCYILQNSIWLDFKIILKTIWAVLKGKGAY